MTFFLTFVSYFVDNSTRYNLKAGTDCINPCLNTNSTSNPCQNGGICIAAYQVLGSKFHRFLKISHLLLNQEKATDPICVCQFGFSGEHCEVSAESFVLILTLWGLVGLALISTASIIIYQCLVVRRDAKPLVKYNITR